MHQKQATEFKSIPKMTSFSIVFEILFLVIIANAQQQPPLSSSELCYLADGSSSLTLTVNEATPVGSVIGLIDVNGNPSLEDGNVDLLDGAPAENRPAATPMADLAASSASSRQNRRLFGRRDTSLAHSASGATQTEPSLTTTTTTTTATASSSFYSLLAAGSTATVTPNSSSMNTATQHNNQLPSAVRVQPGTKNLILAKPLDKESAEGDLSQLVNVRCRPRQVTTAPEPNDNRARGLQQLLASTSYTTIPIRLIITDANDHAPEFVGQLPYVINISETTPLNSIVSRDILALDKDSAGPHSTIHYRVLDDDHDHDNNKRQVHSLASHFAFLNPLEPALSLTSPLDYESLPSGSFTLSIVAQDQGEPEPLQSIAQVQVNVLDSDDQNPRFLDEKYSLVMDEIQASLVGHNLRVLPRSLKAEDGDRGINAPILYSFDTAGGSSDGQPISAPGQTRPSSGDDSRQADEAAGTNVERYLHLDPTSGEIRLIRQWPAAGFGLPLTLVVRACQADNRDRYALTTLTIMRSATASISSDGTQTSPQISTPVQSGPKQGIEFLEQRLVFQVAEDAPINERVARVRAHHIPVKQQVGSAGSSQSGSRGQINYQILDNPNDQFEVNNLGEISLRHSLDYEQRQEFKFRVLATYTKYSDICHVQVAVLNVNDHKPKFTQAQYSLHLTESRLRSNSIGQVQAHDADLNDTVHYSILSAVGGDQQQQVNLFEIGPNGQIALRPGVRQLNASLFQLVVQARDSLGPIGDQHTQQARVNIHVAPQIVSRSLVHGRDQQEHEAASERELIGLAHSHYILTPQSSFSSSSSSSSSSTEWTTTSTPSRKTSGRDSAQRLLKEHPDTNNSAHFAVRTTLTGAESSTVASYQHQLEAHLHQGKQLLQQQQQQQQRQPNPSNQRSSLATVMASLQHMAKSVNFLEMPISSALLLTVLLTFLVCLLLIVVISMSVHVYRISSRARSRRSQHKRLATAARLRHHAQMAAAAAAAAATSASTASPLSSSSSPYNSGASSSTSCDSSQAAPQPSQQHQKQVQTIAQAVQDATRMIKEKRTQNYYDNLATAEDTGNKLKQTRANMVDLEAATGGQHQRSLSLSGSGGMSDAATKQRTSTVTSPSSSSTSITANASRLSLASSPSLLLASAAAAVNENCANKYKRATSGSLEVAKSEQVNKPKRMRELESKQFEALKISISNEITNIALGGTYLCDQPNTASSKQNPLYLESMDTNNSTCAGVKTEPKQPTASVDSSSRGLFSNKSPASLSVSSATTVSDDDDDNSSAANCGHYSVNGTMENQSRQQTSEVKISKVTPPVGGNRSIKSEGLGKTISDLVRGHDHSERRSGKSSEPTPVTIDSYRRLSLMDSLTRPDTSTRIQDTRQQLFGQLMNNKVAPAERSSLQPKRSVIEPQYRSSGGVGGSGLMAMVRAEMDPASQRPRQYQTAAQIKWPSESIPQRIKKLTWDDELSCCDDGGGGGGGTTATSPVETIDSSRTRVAKAHSREHDDDVDECYISPNVRIGSASGDMEREMHRYRDQSQASQTNHAVANTPKQTRRFLFSLSNHTMPSLNPQEQEQQQQQQQQQQHFTQQNRLHDESYQFDPQYLDHLLDDHPSDLTLTSLASGRNQNNCLDYTIVDDSQFLANSLANTSNNPAGKATGGQRQSTGESGWLRGLESQFDPATGSQMAPPKHQIDSMDGNQSNQSMDQNQNQQSSLMSTGQTHVIYKLNQNYQDLKLMTTAIL